MSRTLIKRFGRASFVDTFRYLREFVVDPTRVRCPALAMVGEGEGAEPLEQFRRFADGAAGPVTRRVFTTSEGADGHCQFGNLPLANAELFDWLDTRLASHRAQRGSGSFLGG